MTTQQRKTKKKSKLKKTKEIFVNETKVNDIIFKVHTYRSELEQTGVKRNIPYGQYLLTRNGKDLCFTTDRDFIRQQYLTAIAKEQERTKHEKAFAKTRKKWNILEKIRQWDVLVKKMRT